jgi:hypothetical protein
MPQLLALAKHDNVAVKISGAGTLSHQGYPYPDIWDPLARIFDAFGFDRCMWGHRLDAGDGFPDLCPRGGRLPPDRPADRCRAQRADGRHAAEDLRLGARPGLTAREETQVDFTDKVAIVTGGGNGIGRAVCLGFAARGAKLVVVDRDGDAAAAVAAEIGQAATACTADVTRAADVQAYVARARSTPSGGSTASTTMPASRAAWRRPPNTTKPSTTPSWA